MDDAHPMTVADLAAGHEHMTVGEFTDSVSDQTVGELAASYEDLARDFDTYDDLTASGMSYGELANYTPKEKN